MEGPPVSRPSPGLFAAFWCRAAPSPAAAAPAAAATAAAKRRIRFRIDEHSVEEEIDRLGDQLHGVQRAVVERMIGALNERQRGRHAEGVELAKEVDARLHWNGAIVGAVHEDGRRKALTDVGSG